MLSSNSSREPLGEGAPSGGGGQLGQDAAGRRGPGRSNRARLGGSRTLPRWQTTGCWQADRGPPGRRRAERVFSWAPPTFQAFLSLSTTVLYPSPSFFFFFMLSGQTGGFPGFLRKVSATICSVAFRLWNMRT